MKKLRINFEMRYIVMFLILILLIGIALFLSLYYNNIDFSVIDVMAYATGSVAILTLVYHASSLEAKHEFHKEKITITRNQYAYSVVSQFNDPHMVEGVREIYELYKEFNNKPSKKKEDIIVKIESDLEKRQQVNMVLNYFEMMAILVYKKDIDEDIIKDSFKTIFINIFNLLKPYIDSAQQKSRTLWYNYETLTIKWSKE